MTDRLRPNDVIEASQVISIGRMLETLQRELSGLGEDLNDISKTQAVVNTRLATLEERHRRTEDQGFEVRLKLAENELKSLKEEARRAREENKDNRSHTIAFAGLVVAILSLLASASVLIPQKANTPAPAAQGTDR